MKDRLIVDFADGDFHTFDDVQNLGVDINVLKAIMVNDKGRRVDIMIPLSAVTIARVEEYEDDEE